LSDTHLLSDPSAQAWGHNPAENLALVMNALPAHVDVMVVTGDVVQDGSVEAYRLAQTLIEGRATHTYFVPGNHDDRDAMGAVLGPVEDLRVTPLSDRWTLVSVNTQWLGHDAGYIPVETLDRLRQHVEQVKTHLALCMHHPPISPCAQPECGLMGSDRLLRALRNGPVRVVLSGHVHQKFQTTRDGVTFLGAPSTFRQLRHGQHPHYTDTGEPPAAQLLRLHDNGDVECRYVTGRR